MASYLILAGVAFGLSLIVSWFIIRLAYHFNWLDYGQQKRPQDIHPQPTPRLAGAAVFLALFLSLYFFHPAFFQDILLVRIFVALFLVLVVGLADDLFNLNPYLRLVTNTLAALIVITAGVEIKYITNPFGGGVLNFTSFGISFLVPLISLLWLVWLTNVISWSKGVDGQYPGLVSLGLLAVGGLSLRFSADPLSRTTFLLALAASAAFAGLLFWNLQPQKIMPGYSAGSLGGFLLGVISMMAGAKLATLFIVMGVPLLDGIYAIFRRLKQGRSPVWGDDQHLHHLLLKKLHWSKRKVALFYWLVTFCLGLIGLHLRSSQKMFTIVLVTFLFISLILWLKHFFIILKPADRSSGLKT